MRVFCFLVALLGIFQCCRSWGSLLVSANQHKGFITIIELAVLDHMRMKHQRYLGRMVETLRESRRASLSGDVFDDEGGGKAFGV